MCDRWLGGCCDGPDRWWPQWRAVLATAAPGAGQTLFTLVGHGWGHGIGMSQYGSLGYAMHG